MKKIFTHPQKKKKKKKKLGGGVYTMENKDTNTDYQKVVRVVEQMWDTVEITIRIIFLFKICYFLSFHVPPEQNYPHLSPFYINIKKNGSTPPSHHPMEVANYEGVCQNIYYSAESSFLFRGNSMIQLDYKKNEQSKTGILMKLAKHLVINASSLWTRY